MIKAQVIYDFEAQPSSGELSVRTGEVLTIIRQDVGDGWWEGQNHIGETGLFPQAYVEVIDAQPEPQATAPPEPGFVPAVDGHHMQDWGEHANYQNGSSSAQLQHKQSAWDDEDLYDDDWSDNDSQKDANELAGPMSGMSTGQGRPQALSTYSASTAGDIKTGSVRKNIYRFSNFVKSGMEAYILNEVKTSTNPAEQYQIRIGSSGPEWASSEDFKCVVDKPKKESKLKGLKSFIAYQLTPSFTGVQVSRRYKHFDWLHERLSSKFILTPIPPLPEKQVAGRYEEELIDHRKRILQLWVDKICRHPVLSRSEVFMHFLTCTDEKKWKLGKRRAERDEFTGGNFFMSLSVPDQRLNQDEIDLKIESFAKMSRALDESLKNLFSVVSENAKKTSGPLKREWQKLGAAFQNLSEAFELDPSTFNHSVTQAIKHSANTYQEIGEDCGRQQRDEMDPFLGAIFAYKGTLAAFPEILTVYRSAVSKLRDHERLNQEGKISDDDLESIRGRIDTISYALLAEINHFHKERVNDFKAIVRDFLLGQINFHHQVGLKLKQSLENFENA